MPHHIVLSLKLGTNSILKSLISWASKTQSRAGKGWRQDRKLRKCSWQCWQMSRLVPSSSVWKHRDILDPLCTSVSSWTLIWLRLAPGQTKQILSPIIWSFLFYFDALFTYLLRFCSEYNACSRYVSLSDAVWVETVRCSSWSQCSG